MGVLGANVLSLFTESANTFLKVIKNSNVRHLYYLFPDGLSTNTICEELVIDAIGIT
jgi:hypothetical protein